MSVSVFVSSPDTHSERRYDLSLTVKDLKGKLETVTGIPSNSQALTLYRTENDAQPLRSLDDDERPLGYFGIVNWMLIKVADTNPSSSLTGQFVDVSQVEKFEISEEEYAKRQDSVLAYKQRKKLGRFAQQGESSQPETDDISQLNVAVNARCEVESGEGLVKRGTVRFVGPTQFGKTGGIWVGVEYDAPYGKNDGSVEGHRYFTCRPSHGAFVRPDRVKTGDFPPVDEFADEEEL